MYIQQLIPDQQQRLSAAILTTSSGLKYILMKGFPLSSFSYQSMQQIFLMPACLMIFAQLKQGQQVVQSRQPSVLLMPTQIMADYSACRQRHWSSCFPQLLLQRQQPIRQHEGISLGVPLQPVETTLFSSLTITAPTEVFMQFDLRLAISAIFMKYWSHVGLKYRITSFSLFLSSSLSSSFPPLLSTLTRTYSKQSCHSCLWQGSSSAINSLTDSIFSSLLVCFRKFLRRCWKLASTSTMLRQFLFLSQSRTSRLTYEIKRTALGVSRNQRKQTSRTCFLQDMEGGFRCWSARKMVREQSYWRNSATCSRPLKGRPMRRIRSIYVFQGRPSIIYLSLQQDSNPHIFQRDQVSALQVISLQL